MYEWYLNYTNWIIQVWDTGEISVWHSPICPCQKFYSHRHLWSEISSSTHRTPTLTVSRSFCSSYSMLIHPLVHLCTLQLAPVTQGWETSFIMKKVLDFHKHHDSSTIWFPRRFFFYQKTVWGTTQGDLDLIICFPRSISEISLRSNSDFCLQAQVAELGVNNTLSYALPLPPLPPLPPEPRSAGPLYWEKWICYSQSWRKRFWRYE